MAILEAVVEEAAEECRIRTWEMVIALIMADKCNGIPSNKLNIPRHSLCLLKVMVKCNQCLNRTWKIKQWMFTPTLRLSNANSMIKVSLLNFYWHAKSTNILQWILWKNIPRFHTYSFYRQELSLQGPLLLRTWRTWSEINCSSQSHVRRRIPTNDATCSLVADFSFWGTVWPLLYASWYNSIESANSCSNVGPQLSNVDGLNGYEHGRTLSRDYDGGSRDESWAYDGQSWHASIHASSEPIHVKPPRYDGNARFDVTSGQSFWSPYPLQLPLAGAWSRWQNCDKADPNGCLFPWKISANVWRASKSSRIECSGQYQRMS